MDMMEKHLPVFIVDGGESTRDAVVVRYGSNSGRFHTIDMLLPTTRFHL